MYTLPASRDAQAPCSEVAGPARSSHQSSATPPYPSTFTASEAESAPRHKSSTLKPLGPRIFGLFLCALTAASGARAADFYIDPVNGSPSGDGSAGHPWQTMQQVIDDNLVETQVWASLPYAPGAALVPVNPGAPVQPGDTLWLRTGFHGAFDVRGAYNSAPITIAAEPGHLPRLSSIKVQSGQHWVFRDLSVSPSHANPVANPGTIVSLEGHGFWGPSWDLEVHNSDIFTVDDASAWGVDQWLNDANSGVSVNADRTKIIGNQVRNVRHGITVSNEDAVIAHNLIDGFSADGMRGLGDRAVFEYNRVQNNYISEGQGDGNHDDGFQSWSVGAGGVGTGEVRDVVLRGNVFINHVDPSHPLRSTMQGIGCFDGLFVNWVVENNVIITDHWHGITFHGMIDSRIVNNTVIDINNSTPGPPWIRLTESNGTESRNVVVRNNLAMDFSIGGEQISNDHNVVFALADAGDHFVAPPYDLHLKSDSPAVDAGSPDQAPPLDVERLPRPFGAGWDLGAHELCGGCLFADGFESGTAEAWDQVVP